RVIDVHRQCVVKAPKSCRYIALSYLWGGASVFKAFRQNFPQLQVENSLSFECESLPRIIKDAMYLVAAIGERYVWIDSICIIQDDDEDKALQISAMGGIYSSALLTVVAGAGSDANAGLLGVHSLKRKQFQHIEIVQGMELVNRMPDLWKSMDDCPWASRGWTYQERKLSRRLLVFTENQAYFNCEHATYREDQHLEAEELQPDLLRWHQAERDHRLLFVKKSNFEVYAREVKQYTSRLISYDSDALNAFAGISQLLQTSFRGSLIFGIPDTAFDAGLLWYPRGRLTRRRDPENGSPIFPSWSWAGWAGPVTYDD
ncbi:HET-domain-containing protein, partial [Glonium stellatum]